ncbi:MAG: hypothetical protein WBD20_24450, partial [Pirellulaceae bacterium]
MVVACAQSPSFAQQSALHYSDVDPCSDVSSFGGVECDSGYSFDPEAELTRFKKQAIQSVALSAGLLADTD